MTAPITPLLTVDILIEMADHKDRPLVFIERRYPPLGWAFPGGFVDVGERVEEAAEREALEETGVQVTLTTLLGVYSDPARDPRRHTVSTVYVATGYGEAKAADDAKHLVLCPPESPPGLLVFDHQQILRDYLRWRRDGTLPPVCPS